MSVNRTLHGQELCVNGSIASVHTFTFTCSVRRRDWCAEMSAVARETSPAPQRPKLIMQPAHPTPVDVAAVTRLQQDNVELSRQVQEQSDTIVALRRDLAGANARLSDITGVFISCILSFYIVY